MRLKLAIISGVLALLVPVRAAALKVYKQTTQGLADVKVYVTDSEGPADCRIYVETSEGLAQGNARWYYESSEGLADVRVYFTDSEGLADKKIYFTKTEGTARCNVDWKSYKRSAYDPLRGNCGLEGLAGGASLRDWLPARCDSF